MPPAQLPDHPGAAPHLHGGIGAGKHQPPRAKGLGNGAGHHQRDQHGGKQQQPDARALGIEPVRHPAGVLPPQPHREPQDQRVERPAQIHAAQQQMRELRYGKDIGQIEEQLFVGDGGMAPVAAAQGGMAQWRGAVRHVRHRATVPPRARPRKVGYISTPSTASSSGGRSLRPMAESMSRSMMRTMASSGRSLTSMPKGSSS